MHLRNVEIFCETVVCRSFSKAAEMRSVSQPTVSQAIHQIEEHLGVTLFDRSQRPLSLTPAGEIYYEGCRALLDGFRDVEDRIQALSGRLTGRVRVASIYSVGLLQMSAHVEAFANQYPEVDLRLDYVHPDEVYARVRSDEADLGLVSFPRDGGDIAAISWQEQEMGVVVAPTHPLAVKSEVTLAELAGLTMVGFIDELPIRRATDRLLKKHRVTVNVIHEFDNVETLKRAVEIGAGAAILPMPTVDREIAQGLLRGLRLRDVEFVRPLGIIHRRHKRLSAAAERFVELLHETAPDDSGIDCPAESVPA